MSLASRLTLHLSALYAAALGLAALLGFGLHAQVSLCVALAAFPLLALPLVVRHGLAPMGVAAAALRKGQTVTDIPREVAPFLAAIAIERERTVSIRTRENSYFNDLSHEFRSSIGILQARVDQVLDGAQNAEFTADIGRMTRLLGQLLLRTRLRLRDLELMPVDLREIVTGIAREMATPAHFEGKAVTCLTPDAPVPALANRGILEDGLRNLILNAIQHTPAGTEVQVTLDDRGLITVRDHGTGIPELYHSEIFEPFWKHRDQSRNGAGLGLMIVRETALLHNGKVTVSNHEEGGAVFALSIPIADRAETVRLPVREHVTSFWRRNANRTAFDFSAILDFSDDAIFTTDSAGRITSWNRAAERIFGYTVPEIIGKHPLLLLLKDRVRDFDLIRERIAQGRHVERYETTLRHRDGSPVPALLSISPVFDIDGTVSGSTAIARDMSERTQAQKALHEKLHLLSTITDNAAEAMFMTDANNRVTFMNRAAERLCGWTFDEMLGRGLHDAIHYKRADGTHFPREECPLLGVYHTREPVREFDDVLVQRDGSMIDVGYSSAPIVVAGTVTGSVLVVQDIRERKKTEAALQQAHKMRAIGNLTGGMAHDFNNVLAIVIANLDALLQAKPDDGEVSELAGNALEAAVSGAELTRRLLAFARRQSLRPEPIVLNALVENVMRLLRRTLGEDIEIVLRLGRALGTIVADPAQLEASLTNLAANARAAMPGGGTLTIVTRNERLDEAYAAQHLEVAPGDYVVVEVGDTGTGMSPETVNRIFEPFFSTKDAQHGTGLGLSMVFGFIKQSGGHIAVSSELGAGSKFRLYFPRVAATRAPDGAASAVPAATGVSYGNGQTVLAVEDNPALRQILVRHLVSLGYRTLEAADARSALDILEAQPVDLLFTDAVMPGMNGFDLAATTTERWPDTKIVMTSGFPEAKAVDSLGRADGLTMIAKPYRKDELSRVLAEALG